MSVAWRSMPKRDPRVDPQRGDRRKCGKHSVEVLERDGDRVTVSVNDGPARIRDLARWQEWAKGSKKAVAECVILHGCAAANCAACGKWEDAELHVFERVFYCGDCPRKSNS